MYDDFSENLCLAFEDPQPSFLTLGMCTQAHMHKHTHRSYIIILLMSTLRQHQCQSLQWL